MPFGLRGDDVPQPRVEAVSATPLDSGLDGLARARPPVTAAEGVEQVDVNPPYISGQAGLLGQLQRPKELLAPLGMTARELGAADPVEGLDRA